MFSACVFLLLCSVFPPLPPPGRPIPWLSTYTASLGLNKGILTGSDICEHQEADISNIVAQRWPGRWEECHIGLAGPVVGSRNFSRNTHFEGSVERAILGAVSNPN